MRYRWLALFPLLFAAVFAAIAWQLADGGGLDPFIHWQRLLVRVLAITGCFAAFSAFASGDHLRRAWFWLGVATVLVLVRDVIRMVAASGDAAPIDWTVSALGVLSNVALLAGVWMLARAWKVAAISLPGGETGVGVVTVLAALLALAVAGPGALKHFQSVVAGDWSALILLVSAVVDILSLCLLAPLLLTTISLRGGLFAWPWGLVTASMLCWLLYDAAAAFGGALAGGFPLTALFRGLAENFLFAAGMAQSFAVRSVREA